MKGLERFEPTNYENPLIWFPLVIVLIVQVKGKNKNKTESLKNYRLLLSWIKASVFILRN
jgi:hypothetical protein